MNTEIYISRILDIVKEIEAKLVDGDYIYRGEPECYDKVSSNLYRLALEGFDSGQLTLEKIQAEDLKEARHYINEYNKEDFEILTQLQHYGCKTNLIDFTTDYHIALFFACDGFHDREGRIVLLKRTDEINRKYHIEKPQNPPNRVMAQKSIFLQPPNGFVDSSDIVTVSIPANLKQWILIDLRKFQKISTQSIYNDLHGFIRHIDLRASREAIRPVVRANSIVQNIAAGSYPDQERQDCLHEAIKLYTKRIEYSPYEPSTYVSQGWCYEELRKFDCAVEAFSKAIFLKPDDAETYNYRGLAYGKKGEFKRAIEDFTTAIEFNPDFVALAYNNRGNAYSARRDYNRAIEDYNRATEKEPELAPAYYNCSIAHLHLGAWEKAKSNLTIARNKGIDITTVFRNHYGGLPNFEQRIGVNLPRDIAAILTLQHCER